MGRFIQPIKPGNSEIPFESASFSNANRALVKIYCRGDGSARKGAKNSKQYPETFLKHFLLISKKPSAQPAFSFKYFFRHGKNTLYLLEKVD